MLNFSAKHSPVLHLSFSLSLLWSFHSIRMPFIDWKSHLNFRFFFATSIFFIMFFFFWISICLNWKYDSNTMCVFLFTFNLHHYRSIESMPDFYAIQTLSSCPLRRKESIEKERKCHLMLHLRKIFVFVFMCFGFILTFHINLNEKRIKSDFSLNRIWFTFEIKPWIAIHCTITMTVIIELKALLMKSYLNANHKRNKQNEYVKLIDIQSENKANKANETYSTQWM